jgi:hypothetical protein
MKRFIIATTAALACLTPTLAMAQGGTLVYRHELRGYVWVAEAPAPAEKVARTALTPGETIAVHEAMAAGLRTNPNPRPGVVAAIAHCERQIADARKSLRKSL